MGDLGDGVFDGAWLVSNFESNNPANTFWKKGYNVYANVDTEAKRFLDFEKWWGNPVLLNAEEIQFIVDELFVGNRLAAGEIVANNGERIDLRKIGSPIIVFCSGLPSASRCRSATTRTKCASARQTSAIVWPSSGF